MKVQSDLSNEMEREMDEVIAAADVLIVGSKRVPNKKQLSAAGGKWSG